MPTPHQLPPDLKLDPETQRAIEDVLATMEARFETLERRIGDMSQHWPMPLPPMRPQFITHSAFEELREAATTRKSMPSDRVEEIFEHLSNRNEVTRYRDRDARMTQIKIGVVVAVLSFLAVSVLTFWLGHFEGRSSAPVMQAPAPH